MKEELLPIGTICSIKQDSRLIMVVGYLFQEYEMGLKNYLYSGYYYPEGLLSNKVIGFNNDDITKVLYSGFTNGEYNNFVDDINKICANIPVAIEDDDKLTISNGYVFDKDGNVIVDANSKAKDNMNFGDEASKAFKQNVDNQIPQNYATEINDGLVNNTQNEYVFDKNGYVIKMNNKTSDNPFLNNVEETKEQKEQDLSIFDKYTFDENGTVIEQKKD